MKKLSLALLSAWLVAALPASAVITLPSVISDHAVLQQDLPATIWGWADPNETITVSLGTQRKSAKADAAGAWQVKLKPLRASATPVEMAIAGSSSAAIKVTDLLVGEVWLGSGQSNMQQGLCETGGPPGPRAAQIVAAAKFPAIRLFRVPNVVAAEPQKNVTAEWVVCNPETVAWFSATLYYFGRNVHQALSQPVGLIESAWNATLIQPWIPREGFAREPALQAEAANVRADWGSPTAICNGMIHPLAPFAIRGVVWYQGESNVDSGDALYTEHMRALIEGWRQLWGQPFPFYFVQIAPFRYSRPPDRLPRLCEMQTKVLGLVPKTGMAVINDIVTPDDIHPRNKQEVGRRLALWALAKDYGRKDLVYSGPLFKFARVKGNTIRITFDHAGSGLVARDGRALTHFAIAGEDRKFVEATAGIVRNTVVVTSPQVARPVAVRFAWDQEALPNLMNKEGLPAAPFRTDIETLFQP
jgi:sialate O-acetylesterase